MPASSSALRPYAGSFGPTEAAHLLRRATLGGCTRANVEAAVEMGLAGSVARLLESRGLGEPICVIDDYPTVRLGDPWRNVPRVGDRDEGWRRDSVREWMFSNLLGAGFSATGRMWMFWINHFGCQTADPFRLCLDYLEKIYYNAFGNFRDLVEEITVDGLMLRFLNGKRNTAEAPNENYARELLELFTVGKGPQRGTGDYTNYTEDDVREIARALTGWREVNPEFEDNGEEPGSTFEAERHDLGDKQLSAAFGGAVIRDGGAEEYKRVVEVIFDQPQALHYICRKLYRWFVDYHIDERVEREVIEPLAQVMRAANFDVGVTVRTLLQSEHFFDPVHRGALAKSPLDHLADVLVGFGGALPPRTETSRHSHSINGLYWKLREQGMSLDTPDSVAGYKPYHQEPNFNRLWINPPSLNLRAEIVSMVGQYGIDLGDGTQLRLDLLGYIDTFTNPYDPNDLLSELAERHLAVGIPYDQVRVLKEFLIPDLPDWEWTVEYGLYRDNPDDMGQRRAVERRVIDVWRALCQSAEFALY